MNVEKFDFIWCFVGAAVRFLIETCAEGSDKEEKSWRDKEHQADAAHEDEDDLAAYFFVLRSIFFDENRKKRISLASIEERRLFISTMLPNQVLVLVFAPFWAMYHVYATLYGRTVFLSLFVLYMCFCFLFSFPVVLWGGRM